MDPIATLLLARTHTVVLDADRVASAATRPARDADVDRFEDELLQLGFVMSLDLAMTVRRLPHETLRELKTWIVDTLAKSLAERPTVQLHPLPASTTNDPYGTYIRRALTWLATRSEQPCPWCGRISTIGALDPCGHLVCRDCWTGGNYSGCSICHRRVRSLVEPFAKPDPAGKHVEHHDGSLRVVHLALDVEAQVKARFERMLARTAPLPDADRAELETVIDTIGPKIALWLPPTIPVPETAAITVARLWLIAPDRVAMMKATQHHLGTATDILRIAAVLMTANPSLREPMKLASVPRSIRRALLLAIDRLPLELAIEDMRKHRGLWKRIGERLHPGEWAKLPTAAAAFAAVRSNAPRATWAGIVEAQLAAGDARAAAAKLVERPAEFLHRFDHLARTALAKQPDALGAVLDALREAAKRGTPEALLQLAAHVADRMPDATAILRTELLARAAARRNFARAVIDRGLAAIAVGRATLWDVAAIHAAARANTIYVRDDATSIATYKRRDGESQLARLNRLHAGEYDGASKIPPANAPTWFALLEENVPLPQGSEGFPRLAANELVAELGAKS